MNDKVTTKYEIIVRLLSNGQVQVAFPLNKTGLCTEMLREAANVIKNNEQGEGGRIIAPDRAIVEV